MALQLSRQIVLNRTFTSSHCHLLDIMSNTMHKIRRNGLTGKQRIGCWDGQGSFMTKLSKYLKYSYAILIHVDNNRYPHVKIQWNCMIYCVLSINIYIFISFSVLVKAAMLLKNNISLTNE